MKQKFLPAINGLKLALQDKGILTQMILGIGVVFFGYLFKFSYVEWLVVLLAIGLVVGFEIINTCIEKICDLYSRDENPKIKVIKDLSAGSVLFSAMIAFVLFVMIVLHRIL
ncbi:MAG: diacylglycerol kinase family protein [Solobacterium sp.]|nr:diacylglycerol kinase family protein [Solobacterium sp.]